ncbi:hypothetical protein TorRG33x02_174480, partial [Trema orientale]
FQKLPINLCISLFFFHEVRAKAKDSNHRRSSPAIVGARRHLALVRRRRTKLPPPESAATELPIAEKWGKTTAPSFRFFDHRIAVRRPVNPISAPLDSSRCQLSFSTTLVV